MAAAAAFRRTTKSTAASQGPNNAIYHIESSGGNGSDSLKVSAPAASPSPDAKKRRRSASPCRLALSLAVLFILSFGSVLTDFNEWAAARYSRRCEGDGVPCAREGVAERGDDASGGGSGSVWISLSLCVGKSSDQLAQKGLPHKISFPYEDAAVSAVSLWTSVAGTKVIVTVVTDGDDELLSSVEEEGGGTSSVSKVVARLREAGAAAVRVVRPDPKLGCVTESQMQRMYAYEHEDVLDDDIVVTSDVDSFPTTPAVLDPLSDPSFLIWVWQWSYAETKGFSFPLSFIGMRASLWRIVTSILFDGLDASGAWSGDQLYLSRALLKLRLCSVRNGLLWHHAGLAPKPFNDTGRCFHGSKDHRHGAEGGWKWVHLTPGHNSTDVTEITELISRHHEHGTDRTAFTKDLAALWRRNWAITMVQSRPLDVSPRKPERRPLSERMPLMKDVQVVNALGPTHQNLQNK